MKNETFAAIQTYRDKGKQPIYFFDGDFRIWEQVERRAMLNWAVNAHMPNTKFRN